LVAALLTSFTRGAILLFIVGLSVAFVTSSELRVREVLRGLAAVATAIVVLALIAIRLAGIEFLTAFQVSFLDRIRVLYQLAANVDLATSYRVSNWQQVIGLWRDNPITGLGYKSLYLTRHIPPDNNFLSVLVEQGILGLTAFLGLLAALLRATWRLSRVRPLASYGTMLLALWCGQIAQMMTADVLTFWRSTTCYLILTTAALSIHATLVDGARSDV
jgi:O-antigen ligase